MRATIRIELPPGVEDTPDVRARLAHDVARQLGVELVHDGCEHDDTLEKSEAPKPAPRMMHAAPQAAVDRSVLLYRVQMLKMIDEIAVALAE